ncbi:MAG TPA: sensor histidine kinase [Bryobacterales bacterium]|nr:sensor histidine kinase [Bryobacterales bacterium]
MSSQQITRSSILRVLFVGFALVILLLLAAAFVGLENIRSIKENAASLVEEQLVTTRLIDEIQREEGTLTAVFHSLERRPEMVDRNKILAQLDESDRHIQHIVAQAAGAPEESLWRDLRRASAAFAAEVRRLLADPQPHSLSSRELFRRHDEVIAIVGRLINASYVKAATAEAQIRQRAGDLETRSLLLLGASLLLAFFCVGLTVRMTTQLFQKMEWQTGELSRVSWHMLETQETAARRFSHELHDELGQCLTAVKANLAALGADPASTRSRIADCTRLVDEAIRNIREVSQLLRPTILDDFGLDAGLRWLGEGFTQRTGIEVEYESNFTGRLADETETHLFRITQEALTNVARHSGATRVRMRLHAGDETIRLSIADNGRGLQARPEFAAAAEAPQHPAAGWAGMGMIGMRARARDAGGEVMIRSENGSGVLIEVEVPAQRPEGAPHYVPALHV